MRGTRAKSNWPEREPGKAEVEGRRDSAASGRCQDCGVGRDLRGFREEMTRLEEQNVRETRPGRFGRRGIHGRQVHLRKATIDQGDIDPNKVMKALQRPALAEAASAPLVFGLDVPANALVLSQCAPSLGDRARDGQTERPPAFFRVNGASAQGLTRRGLQVGSAYQSTAPNDVHERKPVVLWK